MLYQQTSTIHRQLGQMNPGFENANPRSHKKRGIIGQEGVELRIQLNPQSPSRRRAST
jgi:hypothetical protein